MSLLASRASLNKETPDDNDDEQPIAGHHASKLSNKQDHAIKGNTNPSKEDSLKVFIDSLREPEDRHHFHMMCKDGVLRVIRYLPGPPDEITPIEIYDAKPMSPEMIKSWLDRGPWSQEKENRFRGVDGRTVPEEQWMNPPAGLIPSRGTKNERDEAMRKHHEKRAQLEQKVANGEVDQDAIGAPCMAVQSDYDLRPR